MAEGYVHTVHREDAWTMTIEDQHNRGRRRKPLLEGVYQTKEEAVVAGQMEAHRRHTEHAIHNEDGSIGERNSYDPAHRPG